MARIPLYNDGQVPAAPTGGVRVPSVAQGVTSGPAVGQALVQIGGALVDLNKKHQDAIDARHLLETENDLQKETLNFAQWQQANPDESKWLDEWKNRTSTLENRIGERPMTDQARLSAMHTFGRWSTNQTLDLHAQTIKRSGQRAMDAGEETLIRSRDNRDKNGALQVYDTLQNAGVMTPEAASLAKAKEEQTFKGLEIQDAADVAAHLVDNKRDFNGAIEAVKASPMDKAKKERVIGGIEHERELYDISVIGQKQPKEAISLVQAKAQAGKVSWLEADKIIQQARSRELEMSNEATADYALRLRQQGKSEAIMGEIVHDPNLTEKARADLTDFIDARVNHVADYASLYAKAKAFEGQKGSPEYGALLNEVDLRLNGQQKSDVQAVLENATTSKQDHMTRTKAQFYSSVADEIKQTIRVPLLEAAKLPPEIEAQVATFRRDVAPQDGWWFKTDKTNVAKEAEARKSWYESKTRNEKDALPLKNYVVEDYAQTENRSRKYLQILHDVEAYDLKNKPTPDELSSYFNKLMGKRGGVRSSAGSGMPTGQTQTVPAGILPPPSAADIEELRARIKLTK